MISHWSHENQQRAQAVLDRYPEKRSAAMPLLYIAAHEHGYVTEDAMREVAELTGLTAAQIQAVASFYTMYKRDAVGK